MIVGSGILILVILLIRRIFWKKCNPNVIYFLWIFVAFRILLPVNIPLEVSGYPLTKTFVMDFDIESSPKESNSGEDNGGNMKKSQLIFLWILMIGLCGCGKKEEQGEILMIGKSMEIVAFSFTHTGMSTEQCFLYSAEQTEDGIRLYAEELFSGGLIVDAIVDETVLEQLGKIASKYRLDRWDGFDKNNKHVMDGYNFSLSVTLAYAHWYNIGGS